MITIGADPEFEIYQNGHFRYARDYFRSDGIYTKLGHDGASSTGELRPTYGSPNTVCNSLNRLLTQAKKKFGDVDILAGSGKQVPLGGHIHFGQVWENPSLLRLLDRLITEPLNEISDTYCRTRHGYGYNGEVRSQPHGFEYRSPLSWISHPVIARGILEVAYAAAHLFDSSLDYNLLRDRQREIEQVMTIDDFMPYISEQAKPYVTACYDMVSRIKSHGLKLEQVEVFRAWRKKPIAINNDLPSLPTPILSRELANQANFRPVWQKFAGIVMANIERYKISGNLKLPSIIIAAAASHRTSCPAIFVPNTLWHPGLGNMTWEWDITHWELPSLGLSVPLRSAPNLCSQAVWQFLLYFTESDNHDLIIKQIEEG